MMCEPLRGKIRYKDINWSAKPYGTYTQANLKLDDVKSAVEFYKKYYHKPALLKEKELKHYELYKEKYPHKYGFDENGTHYILVDGFEWFDYCFQDVIE